MYLKIFPTWWTLRIRYRFLLDHHDVRSSLHFSILSLHKNPNTLIFSHWFTHQHLCVIVCLYNTSSTPIDGPVSVYFIVFHSLCFQNFFFLWLSVLFGAMFYPDASTQCFRRHSIFLTLSWQWFYKASLEFLDNWVIEFKNIT